MYSIGRLMSLLETQNVLQWLNVFVSPCFAELQSITQTQVVCNILEQKKPIESPRTICYVMKTSPIVAQRYEQRQNAVSFEHGIDTVFIAEYESQGI